MRVCIVTCGPLGSNPRAVKEAEALTDAGHYVTAIATRTLMHLDPLDDAVLANADWQAQRLDFRARGNRWRFRRVAQMAQTWAFSVTGLELFAEGGISPFTASLVAAAKMVAADLYVAHYPGALPAAARAARINGARYAYDAEDFHLGEWPDSPEFDSKRRLLRAVEGRYLMKCAYVTAASPGIANAYAEAYGILRPTVVLNVFPRSQAPAVPTAAGSAVPGPSVYWFSQTIGPDRGLETAVAAIGRAQTKPHLYIRGSFATGFADRLHRIAGEVDAVDRLHFLTSESPLDLVRLASAYDVGLSSEPGHTHNNRIALGNKIFTCLLAGIAVLLSDISAHRALALQAGRAVHLYAAENADSLAAAMDELLGDPQRLADARVAAFRLAQARFNWDVEKTALLESVAQPLPRPRHPSFRLNG